MKHFVGPAALLMAVSTTATADNAATPTAADCLSTVPLTEKLMGRLKNASRSEARQILRAPGCNVPGSNGDELQFDMKTPRGSRGEIFLLYEGEEASVVKAFVYLPDSSDSLGHQEWFWTKDGSVVCSDFSGSHLRRCKYAR